MAKQKNLKQKLKAADRRRRQRAGITASASDSAASDASTGNESPSSSNQVDVVDLLVREIVRFISSVDDEGADALIVASLRSCMKGSSPNGAKAKTLSDSLYAIEDRDDVSRKAFHKALEQLLKTAASNQDMQHPSAFCDYLCLLIS